MRITMADGLVSVLHTIWQADGSFPSGSFAFSYGIEGVVAIRETMDAADLAQLTETVLCQRWATFDQIALVQACRAQGDLIAIVELDHAVEAAMFGDSLRAGSRRNGGAFIAAHARIGTPAAILYRDAVRSRTTPGHIAVMQGAVWQALGMDERHCRIAAGYAVASGAIAAAVRLNAIGALDGQRMLRAMLPLIDDLSALPIATDAQLSGFLPFMDIAAARHTRADLRLFSN